MGLLDIFKTKKSDKTLYRTEATNKILDYLVTSPDPDEILKAAGLTRKCLRSVAHDDEVFQCWQTRLDALLGIPLRFEPYNRWAKVIEKEIEPIQRDFLTWVFDAIPYGYSVIECVYQQKKGYIGLATSDSPNPFNGLHGCGNELHYTSGKPFEWFRPTEKHGLRYFPEDGSGGSYGIECSPLKFILSVNHPSYNNPQGIALLSRLYWPVQFRRNGWKSWIAFLERFGEPIITGQTFRPEEFASQLKTAGYPWAISVGTEEKVNALFPAGQHGFPELEKLIIDRIQKVWLGQTGTSGVEGSGSYAALTVLAGVKEEKLLSDISLAQNAWQKVVDNISYINGQKPVSVILATDIGLELERAQRDAVLSPVLKECGLYLSKQYFLDRYDVVESDLVDTEIKPEQLPSRSDGSDYSERPQETPPDAEAKLSTIKMSEPERFGLAQQGVEKLTELSQGQAPDLAIDEELLRSAITAATDEHDLERRLASLLDKQSKDYQEVLGKASFASQVLGYVAAQENQV